MKKTPSLTKKKPSSGPSAAERAFSTRVKKVRAAHEAENVPFVEIYAEASLEALSDRDVKGLYKKALAGEIPHFTGVSDPYEVPTTPEVTVHTDRDTVAESLSQILGELERRGLIG